MTLSVMSAQIKRWGKEVGFDLVGVAPAAPMERGEYLRQWLEQGRHGRMEYLARHVEKRIDPRKLMGEAKSIICTATSYYTGDEPPASGKNGGGRIARFAWGADYHEILRGRLHSLAERIQKHLSIPMRYYCFVDTAPLAEKAHAVRAGLGWMGGNTLLLNREYGSWLVLGEILCDLELEYDVPAADGCGDCRLCVAACPTGALTGPGQLDARRCISYWTVEYKGELSAEQAGGLRGWCFGCDICQEVCPYNQKVRTTTDAEFQPREPWSRIRAEDVRSCTEEEFRMRFKGSVLRRAGREHLRRVLEAIEKAGGGGKGRE